MLLKLNYDGPLSNFAFNVSLRRYSTELNMTAVAGAFPNNESFDANLDPPERLMAGLPNYPCSCFSSST